MSAPAFFHQKLPGFDYRKSPERRWLEYSLEDVRHPQDPKTTGPCGERASRPPWSRSSLSADIGALQRKIAEIQKLVETLQGAENPLEPVVRTNLEAVK